MGFKGILLILREEKGRGHSLKLTSIIYNDCHAIIETLVCMVSEIKTFIQTSLLFILNCFEVHSFISFLINCEQEEGHGNFVYT